MEKRLPIGKPRAAALEIRLRRHASFQKKLRQLVGKCATKKGARSALFEFPICSIRRKF
jgi:hypothetical protein